MTDDQAIPPTPSTAVTPEHAPKAMPNAPNSDPFPRSPEPEHSIAEAEVKPSGGNQEPRQTPFIREGKALTDKPIAEDHYPPEDNYPIDKRPDPRVWFGRAPDTLPEWARIPEQPSPAPQTAVWTSAWGQLSRAYFAARRAIAAQGPEAVPAEMGPSFVSDYTTTELFARATDAAYCELSFWLPRRLHPGGAIAIAFLAYTDAARDRADREWAVARRKKPPTVNPFAPAGPPGVRTEPPIDNKPK